MREYSLTISSHYPIVWRGLLYMSEEYYYSSACYSLQFRHSVSYQTLSNFCKALNRSRCQSLLEKEIAVYKRAMIYRVESALFYDAARIVWEEVIVEGRGSYRGLNPCAQLGAITSRNPHIDLLSLAFSTDGGSVYPTSNRSSAAPYPSPQSQPQNDPNVLMTRLRILSDTVMFLEDKVEKLEGDDSDLIRLNTKLQQQLSNRPMNRFVLLQKCIKERSR